MIANRIKPIYLMNTQGVTELERRAVRDGIDTLLKIAGTDNVIKVEDFGYWNQGSGDFESIDWYVNKAMTDNFFGYGRQLNASVLLHLCYKEDWQKTPHYEVFAVDKDLCYHGLNFIIGLGDPIGTIFSVVRFRNLDDRIKYECIKTETMHELGHTFKAAKGRRGVDALTGTTGNNGTLYMDHCANECVMRQGVEVPKTWIKISQDRLKSGIPFCGKCTDDLISFFRK
jgi:predicted Zn-dependent protease